MSVLMNHKEKLSGIYPPVMTPFKEDQTIDFDALAHNIKKMNETKLIGYMPLGSNGEFHSLSDAESLEVIKVIKENAAPDKVIMAGASRESAYHTLEFIKALSELGIDYASILSPSYFASKMDDEAIISYFTYVADKSPVPILLYCAPKFAANVTISPKAVSVLCEHPNIVGMKDTSSADISSYCQAVAPGSDFHVLAGSINKYLQGLEAGAVGGVLSIANYMPEQCCRIEALYKDGKKDQAQKLSDELIAFNKNTAGKFGVAGVKAAMDFMGYRGCWPRNPLFPISDDERAGMKEAFIREGYLK